MSGRDDTAMADFEVEGVDGSNPADDLAVDRHGDIDQTLALVVNECRLAYNRTKQEQLITIRVQPSLLRPARDGRSDYIGWRGLSWLVSVRTFKAGQAFRRTMDEYFKAVHRVGWSRVEETLKALE